MNNLRVSQCGKQGETKNLLINIILKFMNKKTG